jgi:hypothetical protein
MAQEPSPAGQGGPPALTPEGEAFVKAARDKAHILYEGVVVPHRSCGIALAETFGRETGAYQSLRRGGVLGQGECGAIVAGRLILGELLGDPDPSGAITPVLREAMERYEERWRAHVDRGAAPGESIVCNTLTGPFPIFRSPERHAFCTAIATEVATAIAEVLAERGAEVPIIPVDRD